MENILDGSSPVGSGDNIFYLADMITDPPVPPIKGSLDETAMSALMKEFRNKKAADAKVKTLILQHCTATCKTNLTELEVQTSASYWKYLTTRFGHGTSAGHGRTEANNEVPDWDIRNGPQLRTRSDRQGTTRIRRCKLRTMRGLETLTLRGSLPAEQRTC